MSPYPLVLDHVALNSSCLNSDENLENCSRIAVLDKILDNFEVKMMYVNYITEVEVDAHTYKELASVDCSFLHKNDMDYDENNLQHMVVFPLVLFWDHNITFPVIIHPIINQIILLKFLPNFTLIKSLPLNCSSMILCVHFPFLINFRFTQVKS